MRDTEAVVELLRARGVRVEGGEDAEVVAVALAWLGQAARLCAAVDDLLPPTTGPITTVGYASDRGRR